jgi:hypothetical protein
MADQVLAASAAGAMDTVQATMLHAALVTEAQQQRELLDVMLRVNPPGVGSLVDAEA